MNAHEIPKDVQDFGRELGELCAKHKLFSFQGHIRPGYRSKWLGGDIQFIWDSGRHGIDACKIKLISTVQVEVECPIGKPKQALQEEEKQ